MIQIFVSGSSDEPLYLQILNQLKNAILNGEIEQGEALPSIRALAAELSISVITTKRAYDELEQEGLLEAVPGKGFFAAGSNKMIRERRICMLEEHLNDAVRQAKYLSLSRDDLHAMIDLVYMEAHNDAGN